MITHRLYHIIEEIAIGAGEFAAACTITAEVVILWEAAAAMLYGGTIPAWCIVGAAVMILVPLAAAVCWAVRRITRRKVTRYGLIDSRTICRILRGDKNG